MAELHVLDKLATSSVIFLPVTSKMTSHDGSEDQIVFHASVAVPLQTKKRFCL